MRGPVVAVIAIVLCMFQRVKSNDHSDHVTQDIYRKTINQTLDDAESIVNIVGSVIIRETRNTDEEIIKSESNKRTIVAAIKYVASLIINRIRKRRQRKKQYQV